MAQPIRNFSEALRRGMAVRIVCGGCAREALIPAAALRGWVRLNAEIEAVRFRCRACRGRPAKVRYTEVVGGREDLTPWTPPDRPPPYG